MKKIKNDTDFGRISLRIKKVLKDKKMSIYKLSQLSGIKYNIVYKYCQNRLYRYDRNILAKFCYVLECNIDEIMCFTNPKE